MDSKIDSTFYDQKPTAFITETS